MRACPHLRRRAASYALTRAADAAVANPLRAAIEGSRVSLDEANALHPHLVAVIPQRAVSSDYQSNIDADGVIAVLGLDRYIDPAADTVARSFFHAQRKQSDPGRAAAAFRHPGDVGTAFGPPRRLVAGNAAQAGDDGARPRTGGGETQGSGGGGEPTGYQQPSGPFSVASRPRLTKASAAQHKQIVAVGLPLQAARSFGGDIGTQIAVLSGHEDLISSVAFSPDGRQIVTASAAVLRAATPGEAVDESTGNESIRDYVMEACSL